jgi:hypothetical protein
MRGASPHLSKRSIAAALGHWLLRVVPMGMIRHAQIDMKEGKRATYRA